ncbi:MAG: CPBP family intramembrane metalloprotease [Anaerolineae bacterium]|nr:CPBP family intramembrane metalloprotease [Anaerolineae bacterium]
MGEKRFDWRLALILWAAGVVGVAAVIPYSLTLQGSALEEIGPLPVPLGVVIVAQVSQNAVLVAIAVGLGLLLAGQIGLGAPIIEGLLAREPVGARLRQFLPLAVLLGAVGAIAIILLDLYLFVPGLPQVAAENAAHPPAWQGFLASFYGGITEELFLRLLVMSLLAWLIGLLWRGADGKPTPGAFWAANILAAILFGLGHLPATAAIFPLTGWIVLRAVVLNGVVGLACGYLYWQHGLESAMVAHFSADIVLHVLLPLLAS